MQKGEHYEMEPELLQEADIHLTLDSTGRVLVIKQKIARGHSRTLYKWTGEPPPLPAPPPMSQRH